MPHLITFGSTHLGRLGRFAFGGGAESVLTGSPCPVAVAPHEFRESGAWRPRTIGDRLRREQRGRPRARACAQALALAAGATLRLIAVEPTWLKHRIRMGGPPPHGHDLMDRLDAAVERAQAIVPAERTLLSGDPAGTLGTEAAELDALVIGSRAHGPLGRVLLSSVSAA